YIESDIDNNRILRVTQKGLDFLKSKEKFHIVLDRDFSETENVAILNTPPQMCLTHSCTTFSQI
ncbi:MAG: hypothetical protein SPI75_04555, partial [Sodaliphilus sp.]|nr:hypothetical protein [Sodaliphilus sp.]